jgi:hypothetical protein
MMVARLVCAVRYVTLPLQRAVAELHIASSAHIYVCRSMAEALADTKENMVSELHRALTVDLVDRIKVS